MVKNPVLRGFHPDPSLLRVGEDYYLATSTFEWVPGVRIYHSKNLKDWEYLTAPLEDLSKMDLRGIKASDGIWAPCLSYDGDTFYLIYTVVHSAREFPTMDTPNYLIRAKKITGPWSEPVFLNSSGFDPSLFHDRDGRKWLVNMEWDYRKVLSGGHPFTGILLQEYDPVKERLVGESCNIFAGSPIGSTEGPHLYWHEGYYYLMCAEGGTGWHHAVTVARSRELTGPYELCPWNPILTSWEGSYDREKMVRELDTVGTGKSLLKKAGHGSMIQASDGRWFLAHLTSRSLPRMNFCPMGRETAIQELVWEDGWPRLKCGGRYPQEEFQEIQENGILDECQNDRMYRFFDEDFLKDFQTLRVPYSLTGMTIHDREGYLRIYGRESVYSEYDQALLARRQSELCFEASTRFSFLPTSFQHSAGLIYRYDERNQYYAFVTKGEEGNEICLLSVDHGQTKLAAREVIEGTEFELSLSVREEEVRFFYLQDGVQKALGETLCAHVVSDDYAEGFTGAFVGICVQDLKEHKKHADFAWFRYRTD